MPEDRRPGQEPDQDEAGREEAGHQANVNQVRDEPMPASRHDDPRQDAVERNEDYSHTSEEGTNSG